MARKWTRNQLNWDPRTCHCRQCGLVEIADETGAGAGKQACHGMRSWKQLRSCNNDDGEAADSACC